MSAPQTVLKALALLDLVFEQPGLTVTELAGRSGVPVPTAHRLLQALRSAGLVRVDPATRYHLGSRCLSLGFRFLEGIDVRAEAQPHLEKLVAVTGETAHLGVPEGTEVLYVGKVDSPQPVRMYSRIGARSSMYCSAMGKAILAHDAGLVDEVTAKGMPRRTPNTITDPSALAVELERVRERGWAVDDVENEAGIRCVGAAVLVGGRPLGALSVSAPAARLPDERLEEVAAHVTAAAREIAAALGATEEGPRV